ncbi:MAG: SCF ubiquitin ligase complex subunit cdc4 [Bogoriella megaspora]|nr:MAG: SCF ubiquitin ligase complex subunit cdc4 [Bogoriella megaspora]
MELQPRLDDKASSHSTLGQLSYGPATQKTVVTTTTTTITNLAPIVLKPCKHLYERDPKMYPLASTPTPQSLKKVSFNLGDQRAYFEEPSSPERQFQEYKRLQAALQSSNGSLTTTEEYDVPYKTPTGASRHAYPRVSTAQDATPAAISSLKRPKSPVSIVEATSKIVDQQSRNKRRRIGSSESNRLRLPSAHREPLRKERFRLQEEASMPETPDSDSAISAYSETPGEQYPDVPTGRPSQLQQARRKAIREAAAIEAAVTTSPRLSRSESSGPSQDTRDSVIMNPIAGVSATPPIAENDLDAVSEISAQEDPFIHVERPNLVDTSSQLDASLPSPSASPVTATANLARSRINARLDPSGTWSRLRETSPADSENEYALTQPKIPELPQDPPNQLLTPNPQSSSPTLMDIPTMIDSFDALPPEMQTYVMYQLLRRSAKPTLHFVAEVVNPALKCDFLDMLPLELSMSIVKCFDYRTMCRAAQVSKKWRRIIDSDEKAWKDLVDADGFDLPEGELAKAIKQGWGWQHPYGHWDWERDIGAPSSNKGDPQSIDLCAAASPALETDETVSSVSALGRPKRKAAPSFRADEKRTSGLHSGSKRRKTNKVATISKLQPPKWLEKIQKASGPNTFANAAAMAVPNPKVGLASLKNLHLFKSLYQRHFLIRKSWMSEDIRPQHIAFRAHHRHVVTCLQFDTDKILTGSDDTHINVYDTKTGALRCRLEGHEGGVWALEYEGNTLVSGSTDRSVRIWDIEKGKCTQVFQGHTSTVRCLQILKPTEIGKDIDGTPIMMPKETLIITGSRDSSLRVWKLPQKGQASIIQAGPPANDHDNPYFVRALTGHHHSVRAIAAHGDTLVSGSYDCTVRVWRISSGELVHRLQGHSQKVYSVVLDYSRGRCISGSMDNQVKVWSLETGTCLFNLDGHSSLVGLLDLSHGRLVSAAADSTLRIWDPENGQCKSTLSAHTGAITCFQHDGQKVISGSDRTLKMWDIKSGECVKDLLTDLSGVWQVKFNDRRCVLDFGAARDGVPKDRCGRRVIVDARGVEIPEDGAGDGAVIVE